MGAFPRAPSVQPQGWSSWPTSIENKGQIRIGIVGIWMKLDEFGHVRVKGIKRYTRYEGSDQTKWGFAKMETRNSSHVLPHDLRWRIAKNQLKILPGSLHSLCHLDTLGMPLGFLHDTVLACSCAAALCISKWTLCCSKLWPSTSRIPTNAGNHRLTNSSTRGWPEKEECPKTEGRPRRIVSPLPKLTMNG